MAGTFIKSEVGVSEPQFHIGFLDGLRGLAILLVVAIHCSQFVGQDAQHHFSNWLLDAAVPAGQTGVQLFFILSSFTLFWALESRLETGRVQRPVLAFYIRRAFRILPLWYLVVLIYGLHLRWTFAQMLPALTFYFGFIRYRTDLVHGGWSLFVEETFYLFLPLLFRYVRSLKTALILTICLVDMSWLWFYVAPIWKVHSEAMYIYAFPLAQWFCFGVGISMYFIYRYYKQSLVITNQRVGILLDLAVLYWVVSTLPNGLYMCVAGFVVLFARAMDPNSLWQRIFNIGILRRYGRACYSIYLFHWLILERLQRVQERVFTYLDINSSTMDIRFGVWLFITLVCCLVFGELSLRFFELPAVQLGRRTIAKYLGSPPPVIVQEGFSTAVPRA